MALINSIYAPTPFSTSDGGTGNNLPLSTGQLWGGTSLGFPAVKNLLAGTNIGIEETPSDITINYTGADSFTWQTITIGVNPIVPFTGYIVNGTAACQYNSTAQAGDMYILTTGNHGSVFGITSNQANIHFDNSTISALANTSNNAAIWLVGVGSGFLNVLSYTGAFTTS